ncbi:MAG: hypothetical protein ACKODM_10415 [Cytophagales bacterium]
MSQKNFTFMSLNQTTKNFMKKIYVLLLLCFVASSAFSQSLSFGIRGGINIAKETASSSGVSVSSDSRVGLMLGTYLTVMTSENLVFNLS